MFKGIKDRESGRIHPNFFVNRVRSNRISSLQLSNRKEIISSHRGSINTLQVDLTEGRYLLSGASDGSAAVYDVQHTMNYDKSGLIARHKCLFLIDKQSKNGHKYAVSSANWYPIDTGLFITGSFDHYINAWDTNTAQVVVNFKMPGKVYGTAMSSIASSHMLIAAGTEDVQVRLCDIASGAFTHTLSGHRDGVMAVEWSTSSEWVLISGACDGAIRFWDIRRAGCFLVLNQSQSQLGRRPPLLQRTSTHESSLHLWQSSEKFRMEKKRIYLAGGAADYASSIDRNKSRNKGLLYHKMHPGLMSNCNHSVAHYGALTGLKVTKDGMYLLSAGSDSRIRLWDMESGSNTLVNFEATRLQTSKAIQLATSHDSSLVFVPCMMTVKAFNLWSGRAMFTFRGHYDCVNCCSFDSQDQELYTGSNDRQILVWSSSSQLIIEEGDEKNIMASSDHDNWSD